MICEMEMRDGVLAVENMIGRWDGKKFWWQRNNIGKDAMTNLKIVDEKFCNCSNNLIFHKYGIRNEKVIKAYLK